MRTAIEDLSTPARIRNAAIDQFGRHGFDIGLRTIADEAGVSLGLIRHHFGSKDGLRSACDEAVQAQVGDVVAEYADTTDFAGAAIDNLIHVERFQPLARYIMQTLRSGGDLARQLIEQTVADAEVYLRTGQEKGEIRPSEDPKARARHLVMTKYGAMMLQFALYDDDFGTGWDTFVQEYAIAGLELYTHGLFTDTAILDRYLEYMKSPPTRASDTA